MKTLRKENQLGFVVSPKLGGNGEWADTQSNGFISPGKKPGRKQRRSTSDSVEDIEGGEGRP